MQPNVIVAEGIGHRARFAWLGAALAATIALLVVPPLLSETSHAPRPASIQRGLRWQHGCTAPRWRAHAAAERALREAERETRRALREAERAERRALREAERAAERVERRILRDQGAGREID